MVSFYVLNIIVSYGDWFFQYWNEDAKNKDLFTKIPTLITKKERFLEWHRRAKEHQRHESLGGGPGACSSSKNFMIYASKMPFPTLWDHSQWKCHAQYYITDKRQRMVLKRLVKQRKHYLPLARKSFKNWENIKWKWEAGNIHWNQEVSGQKGRAEISVSMALWTKINKGQVDN